MADPVIRERIQRFALLRAAQRALARCMHPSRLNAVNEQGRQLLIELQRLSDGPAPDALAGDDGTAAAEEALADVDRLLRHQAGMTLEILGDLEFAQLRAEGPRLCEKHADDVRALIDVMLEGDLGRDKNLRLLEYLITLLSTDETNGRRTALGEPSDLTPGLRRIARRYLSDSGFDYSQAETVLGEAMSALIRGEDHLALRDEIRTRKKELGRDILHPRLLACTVAYNVAMWNQIAAQIDSTMAIDQLAEDLLSGLGENADTTQGAPPVTTLESGPILSSRPFARLVTAFSHRIRGSDCGDFSAARIVEKFKLDALRPREILALEADEDEDTMNRLVRAGVVLGNVIRHREEVRDGLESLGLNADLLVSESLEELIREMTSASRTMFAESRYSEAFELSEVKTRNLAALAVAARREAAKASARDAEASDTVTRSGWRLLLPSLPTGSGRMLGLLLGLGLIVALVSQIGGEEDNTLRRSALTKISPFLASANRQVEGDETRLVAKLGPTWDYVATPERRTAIAEIGERAEAMGISSVVLMGPAGIVYGRYQDGEVTDVVPRAAHR